MKLNMTARGMTVSPAITARIEKKTERMGRYFLPETEMFIHMTRLRDDSRKVEITVPLEGNVTLRAEAKEQQGNLFLAIDQALGRIEKQMMHHRTKLEKRLRTDAFAQAQEPAYIEEEEPETGVPEIVRRKTFPMRPMSVEDAAVQMELLGHSFFAFVNMDTGKISVLYQRADGGLGLLEPEA